MLLDYQKENYQSIRINECLNAIRINPKPLKLDGYYFKTKSKEKLFYREWNSGFEPKKVILCVHGMASHGIYFIQVADQFVSENICIYALDLKHHGKSTGKRGHIHDFKDFIDHLYEFLIFLKHRHKGIPIFLMGMSMGCSVIINHTVFHPRMVDGIILISPPIKTRFNLVPKDILKSPIYLMALLLNKSQLVINLKVRPCTNTRNPWRLLFNKYDKLKLNKISVKYLLEAAKWSHKASENVRKISCPVLIIQGTQDHTVDYKGVRNFFNDLIVKDKKLLELNGAFHCILSDPAMIEQNGWEILKKWIRFH